MDASGYGTVGANTYLGVVAVPLVHTVVLIDAGKGLSPEFDDGRMGLVVPTSKLLCISGCVRENGGGHRDTSATVTAWF